METGVVSESEVDGSEGGRGPGRGGRERFEAGCHRLPHGLIEIVNLNATNGLWLGLGLGLDQLHDDDDDRFYSPQEVSQTYDNCAS